jgi:hypothetical protein
VSTRGPVVRVLLGLAVVCCGIVAVAGGLELRGPGLVAVCVAGALVACLAAGIAREAPGADRRSTLEAAASAGGWTVGVLLVLAGISLLAGGVVAALLGVAAAGGVVGVWLLRGERSRKRAAERSAGATVTAFPAPGRAAPEPAAGADVPVPGVSTRALGREWLHTSALLAGPLEARVRASVVRRRQETLDELERRDPVGFARWLASGPDTDPADYVQGDRTAGTDAA